MKGIDTGRKQKGITLIGFAIALIVVCFFAYMGMVLGPAYSEYYGVKRAVNTVAAAQTPSSTDAAGIAKALDRQFTVGYVDSIQGKDVKLVRQKGGNLLNADYEVRKAFVYNIDFVIKFKHQAPLGSKTAGD